MLGSPDNGVPVLKTTAARLRVVMPMLVLAVVALVVYLLIEQGSKSELVGSGSTLAQPLIQHAARDYRNRTQADNPQRRSQTGVDWVVDGSGDIDYQPVGSIGGAIMRLADPEVDFAVTDYPVSATALDEKKIEQFPIAIGAVAVVHNLDLPGDQTLRLDAATTADLFSGRVTRWNDPALVGLNPDVSLPDLRSIQSIAPMVPVPHSASPAT